MFKHESTLDREDSLHELILTPEDLLRLELLLEEGVVDLAAVSKLVSRDAGLQSCVLQLAHNLGESSPSPSIHECIVEIGVEGLLSILHSARLRRRAN